MSGLMDQQGLFVAVLVMVASWIGFSSSNKLATQCKSVKPNIVDKFVWWVLLICGLLSTGLLGMTAFNKFKAAGSSAM